MLVIFKITLTFVGLIKTACTFVGMMHQCSADVLLTSTALMHERSTGMLVVRAVFIMHHADKKGYAALKGLIYRK